MSTQDELPADIIQEALWGDPPGSGRAFGRLYDHYEVRVRYAVARAAHRTGYQHRVDELRQDVWVRLLERDRKLLRYYRPERGPLGPYIARIAYQQALKAMGVDRRQSTMGPEPVAAFRDDDVADHEASRFVANLVQSDLYRKLMKRAVAELDELDMVVLREVHLGQRRSKDVAQEQGLRAALVYKRNERLKKKLAAWCEELLAVIESSDDAGSPRRVPPALLVAAILAGLAAPDPGMFGLDDSHPPVSTPSRA